MNNNKFKSYIQLTKPGIVRGNIIVAIAGYLFAANGSVNLKIFVPFIVGTSFIIASGCVANNYLDKDIDAKMNRTKRRPSVDGLISDKNIILFSIVLLFLGATLLGFLVNSLTLLIGLFGFLFYVVIYGYIKKISVFGTLVGAIPGATPPLAGYSAVSGNINTASIILFFILVFWQMPHFYSIALFRLNDYKRANIPVLPLVKGVLATKYQIYFFLGLFGIAYSLLFYLNYTSEIYMLLMSIVFLWWLHLAVEGLNFDNKNTNYWAKKMFGRSLAVLTIFSVLISLNFLFI